MIQITLTFSSLSAAMEALAGIPEQFLIEAPRGAVIADPKLAAQLENLGAAAAAEQEPAPVGKPSKAAKASKVAAEPPAAPPQPTAPPVAAPAQAAAVDGAETPVVAYADLQKAVLALSSRDHGAAVGIANTMGFASYKAMPPDRWAEALAEVNAALGA